MAERKTGIIAAAIAALLIWSGAASADVVLNGNQHVGNEVDGIYTPADNVTPAQMRDNPSRFHLTQEITVTDVRLNGLIKETDDATVRVFIDGNQVASDDSGAETITLDSPQTLGAGIHTIAVDVDPCFTFFGFDFCSEIGWSAITLITDTGAGSLSVHFNRRRHAGDNEIGDDQYGGRVYPDPPDGTTISESFDLGTDLTLSEIRVYRLRDTVGDNSFERATVRVDGNAVGTLDNDADPFTITVGSTLAAGSHTLEIESGQRKGGGPQSDNHDDISWDDVILVFSAVSAGGGGRFNAVSPGEDPVSGPIFTQISAADITLDIAALDNDGDALRNNYNGTVTVELIDAVDNSGTLDDTTGCRDSWGQEVAEVIGTVDFSGTNENPITVTFQAGSDVSFADALTEARIRLEGTRGRGGGQTDVACSADAFALRPLTFAVEASHDNRDTPGDADPLDQTTGPDAGPIHEAGEPFTILAEAINAAGDATTRYAGTPTSASAVTLLLPTGGGTLGTLSVGTWTAPGSGSATARTDSASYTEVGAFRLDVQDSDFASIDSGDGTPDCQRIIGLSCDSSATPPYASPAPTFDTGRFVPDDFDVKWNDPQFETACVGGDQPFTYLGQPFFYRPDTNDDFNPQATVTAINEDDNPTVNYTGNLFKLTSASFDQNYVIGGSPPGVSAVGSLPAPDVTDNGDGSGTATFRVEPDGIKVDRPADRTVAEFEAEIALQTNISDEDINGGVEFSGNAAQVGAKTSGDGIDFYANGLVEQANKTMRYGRLRLENAVGSERLPLPVPVRVEYFDASLGGSGGFVRNTDDTCTDATDNDIVLDPDTFTSVDSVEIDAGKGEIKLDAPEAPGLVGVTFELGPSLPWLRPDTDDDGQFDDDADATASFGRFGGEDRQIYLRETVGGP